MAHTQDPSHFDVIVVGGGTKGTPPAHARAKRGAKTLVLERYRHVHTNGSHGGKTRIIRHAYAEGESYVPIVRRADTLWQELEEESGQHLLWRTGGLDLSAPGFGYARAARRSAEAHGLPVEWLEPAEVRRRWPVWHLPDDWDACFNPSTGFLLVDASLHALADAAKRRGAVFHEEEPARDWGSAGSSVWVRTDRASYAADRLAVTPGAWAGDLLAPLGVPFTVVRKTLWWLPVTDPAVYAPDRFPVFITESARGGIYGFPIHDGGGFKTADHYGGQVVDPETVDRTAGEEELGSVLPFAQEMLSGVGSPPLAASVCLYEMSPDHDFVVDRHPDRSGVVIAAGFSGHGFKFAPAMGEHLADLALDPAAEPYARFALERFQGRAVAPFDPARDLAATRYEVSTVA